MANLQSLLWACSPSGMFEPRVQLVFLLGSLQSVLNAVKWTGDGSKRGLENCCRTDLLTSLNVPEHYSSKLSHQKCGTLHHKWTQFLGSEQQKALEDVFPTCGGFSESAAGYLSKRKTLGNCKNRRDLVRTTNEQLHRHKVYSKES